MLPRARAALIMLQGSRPEQISYGTGGPSNPENLNSEQMLREAFSGRKIEQLRGHDSVMEEGSGHKE
jgi:hypothetical protein